MSDLHVEAPQTDVRAIRKELDDHAENGRDVFINGDVFDGILVKDAKRYARSAHTDDITDEVVNDIIGKAFTLLSPYPNIQGIGIGNHEQSLITHGGVNPVKLLISALEQKQGRKVSYMGWTGVIVYRMDYTPSGKRCGGWSYVLHYHHGAGGAERVGKGANALYHFGAWSPDADTCWLGHKHDVTMNKACFLRVGAGGNITAHEQHRVQTGAYFDPFMMSYARKMNLPPQPLGGATVEVSLFRKGTGSSFEKTTKVTV